jgi:pimeloyl-ACP methyl ester carboxylesterase
MTLVHRTITVRNDFKVGVTYIAREFSPARLTLVFLHGWSVSALAYTEMLEHLDGMGYQVIALDAADHGRTDSLRWGHTVKDMALLVRQALDKLHVHDMAVIVGHSMGGAIAVEYAAAYPGSVSAAILLNPAAGKHHHETLRIGFTPIAALRVAELVTGALRDIVGDARLATKSRSVTELLSLGRRLGKSLSGARILRAGVALLLSDTYSALDALGHYGVPTVIIHGSDDRIIKERAIHQAAITAGARYEILPGYNHSWMIAQPQEAAERISKWARTIARKAPPMRPLESVYSARG